MLAITDAIRRIALAAAVALPAWSAAEAIEIQRVVSPGGIEAWLVEDHTVPLIAVEFAFRGGASQDPDGKPGVAYFLSAMLDEGAGDLESQAYQRREQEIAMQMSFDAGLDTFWGSFATLETRADEAFEMLALALQEPRFDPDPIERMRAQILSSIRSSSTDPDTVAGLLFFKDMFPNHPYGRPVIGTLETVAAVTREDLVAYRDAVFARDNLMVGVVGAISADELAARLDQVFLPLPETADLVPVPDITPATGVVATDTLPNPQTVIRLGTEGVARSDPDYLAAYVMNHILGGGSFSSRLYTQVREVRGLAYSVGSSLSSLDHASVFIVGTATAAAQAAETLDLIRAEIARMATEGPTEDELEDAKRYLIGNYALRFDTSSSIAGQLVGIQLEDLGIDYFNRRNDLVAAVTLDDVRRLAGQILSPEPVVVTVGPEG
jgi:zinc protease